MRAIAGKPHTHALHLPCQPSPFFFLVDCTRLCSSSLFPSFFLAPPIYQMAPAGLACFDFDWYTPHLRFYFADILVQRKKHSSTTEPFIAFFFCPFLLNRSLIDTDSDRFVIEYLSPVLRHKLDTSLMQWTDLQ